MARINIEECWWSDPRRSKLIRLLGGDTRKADGLAIETWRLAQEFWKHDRKLVPLTHFQALEDSQFLIEASLVEVRGDHVYIRGSSQYLEWVKEQRESASLAGRISAQRPRDSKGRLLPKVQQESNENPTEPNEVQPSVSGSVSDSNTNTYSVGEDASASSQLPAKSNQTKDPKTIAKEEAQLKAKSFVASYVSAYKTRFPDGRPEDLHDGKVRGQILNWIKDYPIDRARQLIQVYFQMDTKWFGTKGYDFLTFRNNLNKIGQALDSGKDPDGNQMDWQKMGETVGAL